MRWRDGEARRCTGVVEHEEEEARLHLHIFVSELELRLPLKWTKSRTDLDSGGER